MGYVVKRVPLHFAQEHPLNAIWPGYRNAVWDLGEPCPLCQESGLSELARTMHRLWYAQDFVVAERFVARQKGRLRTSLDHLWKLAYPHGLDRLQEAGWRRRLEAMDWEAIAVGRGFPPGHGPELRTGALALPPNEQDALKAIQARCASLDRSAACESCDGLGRVWDDAGHADAARHWKPHEPPVGEGWQAWETNGGSPVTPVFRFRDELYDYLVRTLRWQASNAHGLIDNEADPLFMDRPSSDPRFFTSNVTEVTADDVSQWLHNQLPDLAIVRVDYDLEGIPTHAVTSEDGREHMLWEFHFSHYDSRLYRTPLGPAVAPNPGSAMQAPHATFGMDSLWRNSDEMLSGCHWDAPTNSWLPNEPRRHAHEIR